MLLAFKKVIALLGIAALGCNRESGSPRFEYTYGLKDSEGVFAYARVSPNGRWLAYSSESATAKTEDGDPQRTVNLVDLTTKRVVHEEPGIDAYWAPDGQRMIFESLAGNTPSVAIYDTRTETSARDVVPIALGDYYSWGTHNDTNVVLTILGNYFYLSGDRPRLPAESIPPCPDIGTGERPLISRDGRRVTTFVRGTVVVRDLTDCGNIIDTGIHGAKADFSADGRYIAFHAPKPDRPGYEIQIVDLERRTVRRLTGMTGSSFYPSWTADGKLCFRYDGQEFRGFVIASNVLSAPEQALPLVAMHTPIDRNWHDLFPSVAAPGHRFNVVTIWATWNAHSPDALKALQSASEYFARTNAEVGVLMATDPGSSAQDVQRMVSQAQVHVPLLAIGGGQLPLSEADNQVPVTLLFENGRLVDRHLGAQTFESLRDWVYEREVRLSPGVGARSTAGTVDP